MKLTRTTALVVLLFLAVAAPVTAFALADDGDAGTSNHATHPGKSDHGRSHDKGAKPDHATGQESADDASGPGRAHAEAMKAWAHCVAEAASGQKSGEHSGPPKDACGDKPMGPGRARHLADHTGPFAPGHGQEKQKKQHDSSSD